MLGIILKVVTLPFAVGVNSVRGAINIGKERVQYEDGAIKRAAGVLPIAIVIYSLLVGLVSFISFVMNGGYTDPMNIMKKDTVLAAQNDAIFIKGNAQNLFSIPVFTVFATLMIAMYLYTVVSFMISETGFKRVVFAFVTVMVSVFGILFLIADLQCIRDCDPKSVAHFFSDVEQNRGNIFRVLGNMVPGLHYNNLSSSSSIIATGYIVVFVGLIIMYILAKTSDECADIASAMFRSSVVYLGFVPLLVYSIENIIGFGALIIMLLGISILFVVFGGGVGSAISSDGASSTYGGAGSSSAAREAKKKADEKARLEKRIKDNKHGLNEKRNGSWSYGHVDERLTHRQIEADMKALERLG